MILVLLIGGVAALTVIMKKVSTMKTPSVSNPFSGAVEHYVNTQKKIDELKKRIADAQTGPNERVQTTRQLARLYRQEEKPEAAVDLLRHVIAGLHKQVDIGPLALDLERLYGGGAAGDSEVKSEERDESGLVWVYSKRRANLHQLHPRRSGELAVALADLAARSFEADMPRMGSKLIHEAVRIAEQTEGLRKVFAALEGVVNRSMADGPDNALMMPLTAVYDQVIDTVSAPLPDCVYQALTSLMAEAPTDSHAERMTARVLREAVARQDVQPPAEALIALRRYARRQGRQQESGEMEDQLVRLLETRTKGHLFALEDAILLQDLYRARGTEAELAALTERMNARRRALKQAGLLYPYAGQLAGVLRNKQFEQAPGILESALQEVDDDTAVPEAWFLRLLTACALLQSEQIAAGTMLLEQAVTPHDIDLFSDRWIHLCNGVPASIYVRAFARLCRAGSANAAASLFHAMPLFLKRDSKFRTWAQMEYWLVSGGEGGSPRPLVTVPRVPGDTIRIDGSMQDPGYEEAAVVTDLHPVRNGKTAPRGSAPASRRTRVHWAHDGQRLVIAVRACDDDVQGGPRDLLQRDADIWRNDCVEVFTHAARDFSAYAQWIANKTGTVADLYHRGDCLGDNEVKPVRTNRSFTTGVAVAGRVDKDSWTVEMAIPLKDIPDMPAAGTVFPANVRRVRWREGKRVSYSWCPDSGSPHSVSQFYYLKLE